MGAFEDGSTFVTGVLAKLPAELQAQVRDVLSKPEAKDAVTAIGDGVLARSDYSSKMDALKGQQTQLNDKFTELNTWYDSNKNALQAYPTLKAEVDRLKAGKGGDDDDDDANKGKLPVPDIRTVAMDVVNEVAPEYIGVTAWLNDKRAEHETLFRGATETPSFSATSLTRNPKLGRPIAGQPGRVFSLEDAYQEAYGEKVNARRVEIDTARVEARVAERLKEEQAKLVGQPFPLRGGAPEPSVLDTLQTKEGSAAYTVDTAVAEYNRLQAGRASGA